jgi:Spy/CpxP family protein refolding chaperone
MKKYLFLTLAFSAVIATATNAQTASAPSPNSATAAAPAPALPSLQQMQERLTPQMVEKTGLTEAQANKVIELNYEMRMAAGALKDLSEADRSKKIAELKATKEKKMNDLLTAEQQKAVAAFYADMGKNAAPKN